MSLPANAYSAFYEKDKNYKSIQNKRVIKIHKYINFTQSLFSSNVAKYLHLSTI
ncbi:hypothetical protein [Neodiprion abietis nucleopolyhedrovirus]|uniref:Uncharacterized protein n=1 Tax=Neodiprion abietis nucleopolyhedrovirus TaxID=204507 RepID=Q0ZP58_9CBAC|nr:hypothetical protein [Neodiprion abietis nucleopolyhedrovirus]ABC74896.1 unknown [Neodiprion abietis nucleopolyhedrovirus]